MKKNKQFSAAKPRRRSLRNETSPFSFVKLHEWLDKIFTQA